MSDTVQKRFQEPRSEATSDQRSASKKVRLASLKIGPGGKVVEYHFYDGTLYLNGTAQRRRL